MLQVGPLPTEEISAMAIAVAQSQFDSIQGKSEDMQRFAEAHRNQAIRLRDIFLNPAEAATAAQLIEGLMLMHLLKARHRKILSPPTASKQTPPSPHSFVGR